jgi:hypothetical protein
MSRFVGLLTVIGVLVAACSCPSGILFRDPWFLSSPADKPPFTPLSRYPRIDVRIQAIRLRNDDGDRLAVINPEEVGLWVEGANEVFAASGIHFTYDPGQDFATLDSTLLNRMEFDSVSEEQMAFANAVIARYPGRLVIFFRRGLLGSPPMAAFSWLWDNFVAMPGFTQEICGHQYRTMLAHEIGHYLGLDHTFSEVFETVQEAETYFVRHGNVPGVFDGDGLDDTPPDPYIEALLCEPMESLELEGVAFPLPRDNVMSYYDAPTGLSERQVVVARWVLSRRLEHGMALPRNDRAPFAVEAENLRAGRASCGSTETEEMEVSSGSGWNGYDQLTVHAENGCELELAFHVPRAGTYRVSLYGTYSPDYGEYQVSFDGGAAGVSFDGYGPLVMTSGAIDVGEMELALGEHTVGFTVTGKNPLSSGYSFGIDCLSLVPVN